MTDGPGPGVAGADAVARSRLLLQAAETINSSLDSGALEATILGEAARLTGAGAAALLVPRGDVLVAREALGIGDRARDSFVVPLETSVYGRALVSGEIVVAGLGEPEAGDATRTPARQPPGGPWRAVMAAPLQSHRAAYGVLALLFADARPCGDEERAVVRTLAIHAAIALDNRRLMREKEHMAVRDGLTDVFNRGYLELALERTVKDVRRNGGDVSILFVDVDGMKDVNDTHGHHAGDVLLIELAHLLRDSCGRRTSSRVTAATSSWSSCRPPAPPAPPRWSARWRLRSRRATRPPRRRRTSPPARARTPRPPRAWTRSCRRPTAACTRSSAPAAGAAVHPIEVRRGRPRSG